MSRVFLYLILVLGALFAGAQAVRSDRPPTPDQAVVGVAQGEVDLEGDGGVIDSVRPATPTTLTTPYLDQLARLEARRRFAAEGPSTYLDSLVAGSDSSIRRWADRLGRPITVAVAEPPEGTAAVVLRSVVTAALNAWDRPEANVRLALAADSIGADILVTWVEHFNTPPTANPQAGDVQQTGLTSVVVNHLGEFQKARVQLALADGRGRRLSDEEIGSVAVHELGHALGLPHSGDAADVMFPTVRVRTPSARDRASQVLLYRLPPGSLREVKGQ